MAEAILFDLAGTLISKLGSHALQELGLLLGANDELEKLKDSVSAIKAVLIDAEELQSQNNELKDWLSKLKDVFYEIDDLIDEFQYEALRRQVMTRNRSKTKQVRIFFSKSNQVAFSYNMGRKIKEIRERLKVIHDDRTQFHLSERVINRPTADVLRNSRDFGHYIPEQEVIGRNDDKKEIIDLLLNSNTEEDIAVVAIVGMGGLGKTTLAQSVYNDNMITKHFELKLWVCISEEFEVKVIIQNIIEYATRKKPESLQMALLQTELTKVVDGKKYLLVMDDVWNEDHEKWASLKRLLIGGAKGSRILITTREEQVANTFDPTSLHPLEKLNDKNSWLLFKKTASLKEPEVELENSNLVEIGKEIVAKLKGVPLAIRTIGRLLHNNKSKDFWSSFKDKELYQIMEQEGLKDMLSILKLSYNHLSSNLKQCFLYCALFPKDFEIQKNEVIMQWVAQGFIQPNDKDLVDIGENYFMELLSRSFFQDVTTDEFGEIITCKMHDLMHDLACSIVENECTGDVNALYKRTHHVSFGLRLWEELERLPEKLSEAKNLRTCFLQYNYYQENDSIRRDYNFNEIFESVFCNLLRLRTLDLQLSLDEKNAKFHKYISKLKYLRYLKIEKDIGTNFFLNSITGLYNLEVLIVKGKWGLTEFPRDIKNWINLKHLDIHGNEIIEFLPDSITQLKNLESLLLNSCLKLKELPKDIKNLSKLQHLDVDKCKALTHMPKGVGELTNLQTLNLFVIGKDNNGGGLSELSGLNKLKKSLTIKGLQFCSTVDLQTNVKLLQLKSGLQKLSLEWEWDKDSFNGATIGALDDDCERVLECLQPHSNLRHLYISGYRGVKLCNWLSSSSYCFGGLVRMQLLSCERLQHLPQFHQFPNLKDLLLHDLPCIEDVGSNDYPCSSTFFPFLEELTLSRMPNLERWWKNGQTSTKSAQIIFPRLPTLRQLIIYECPSLPESIGNLTSLTKMKIMNCTSLTSLPVGIGNLTSLTYLRIRNCTRLTSLPEEIGNLTSLTNLRIRNCTSLTLLPEGIGNLTSLTNLEIRHCVSLTSLPEGIRHLHCLQSLTIRGCPIAKERCRKATGEDWPKIAHIPQLVIFF